jgi:hypothetical protein
MLRTAYVFTPETVEFLHGGCALVIGTVDDTGQPAAGRGWGIDLLDDGRRARVLLDVDDDDTLANIAAGGAIAITAADVPTLASMQLKGRAVAVEVATGADRARARRFCDQFFADIVETEGTDRALVERMVPVGYVACIVEIDEAFDQTPGPGAGAPMPPRPR